MMGIGPLHKRTLLIQPKRTLFQHTEPNHQFVVEAVPEMISSEDNAKLLHPFALDEFSQDLVEMHKDKAQGIYVVRRCFEQVRLGFNKGIFHPI